MIERFKYSEYEPTVMPNAGRAGQLALEAFHRGIRGVYNGAWTSWYQYDLIKLTALDVDLVLCEIGLENYKDTPQLMTRVRAKAVIEQWTREEKNYDDRRKID